MHYEVEFPLAPLSAESVEAALFEAGATAITFSDRGDEPVLEPRPDEVRLWRDTLVRALFDLKDARSIEAAQSLGRLAQLLGEHITECARVRAVESRDWERVWLRDWKPMRFGRRLWVCPTGAPAPEEPEAVVVRLDPGLAFGTGTHPTTALCLQMLDTLPLTDRTLIDYGCGSGILGIAALKLGAARVVAVDLDPQALVATRDNAVRNEVADRLEVQGVPPRLEAACCVFANILADPLVELEPVLSAACLPEGDLFLSGLLKSQAPAVKAAYGASFAIVQVIERGDWCGIHARRIC
ncbi:MAG: 50S ribosomal protein L11 methyltransferase [Steroidobacteraceae bacterium]|jgi:ribosomal protein L11 methyltransferase